MWNQILPRYPLPRSIFFKFLKLPVLCTLFTIILAQPGLTVEPCMLLDAAGFAEEPNFQPVSFQQLIEIFQESTIVDPTRNIAGDGQQNQNQQWMRYYQLNAYVVHKFDKCTKCPHGAVCEACRDPYIIISDEQVFRSDRGQELQFTVFYTEHFDIGQEYLFWIRIDHSTKGLDHSQIYLMNFQPV